MLHVMGPRCTISDIMPAATTSSRVKNHNNDNNDYNNNNNDDDNDSDNNDTLQLFQLIVLARYPLGVLKPSPVSQHALT